MAAIKNEIFIDDNDADFNTLCQEWLKGKAHVDACNAKLDEIRAKIVDLCQLDDESEDVEHLTNINFDVKVTHRLNRSIDKKMLEDLVFPQGYSLDDCLKKEYAYNAVMYRKLPADVKAVIDKAITSKPGKAGFEITDKSLKENK